jgi:hypothetical protein
MSVSPHICGTARRDMGGWEEVKDPQTSAVHYRNTETGTQIVKLYCLAFMSDTMQQRAAA